MADHNKQIRGRNISEDATADKEVLERIYENRVSDIKRRA